MNDLKIDVEGIVRKRVAELAGEDITDRQWGKLCKSKPNEELFYVMREAINQAVHNTLESCYERIRNYENKELKINQIRFSNSQAKNLESEILKQIL